MSISGFLGEIEVVAEDRAGRMKRQLGCMLVWKREHTTMVSYDQGLQKTNRGLRKNNREDLLQIRGQESLFEGLICKQKLER